MSKKLLLKSAIAMATCTFMLTACGDDSGNNAKSNDKDDAVEIESSASDDEDSSSSVKETKSSSSIKKEEEKSSDSKDDSSESKDDSSESKDDSSDSREEIIKKDFSISGVSQKGPFVSGTQVVGQELDGKTMKQTGRSFRGTISNDKGEFDISSVSLVSQYVVVYATGYYQNEVTGSPSKSVITLNALVDLSDRNTVNVNLLTHLEYERVAQLVADGQEIADAKKQAQKEIFKVFAIEGVDENSEDLNIFGESDNAAALLAVSVLMQGDRSEGELTSLLTDFANDMKKDGSWDDAATKGKIADWAMRMDLSGKLTTIRENVEGWNLGKVPNFEKMITNFWTDFYGLGKCREDNEDTQVKKTGSDNVFVCNDGTWLLATINPEGTLSYVTFDEDGEVNPEKTVFDELDRGKIGIGNVWDYTHGSAPDYGVEGTTGNWFSNNDRIFNGSSIFINSKGQYESSISSPSFLSNEGIKADKGVLLAYQFANLTEEMSVGYLSFGIGVQDVNNKSTTIDISSWEGICVVYASTHPIEIQLGGGIVGTSSVVYLPASTKTKVMNITWNAFVEPEWHKGLDDDLVSAKDAAKKFSYMLFFLMEDTGDTEDTHATFIKAIGKLDGCSTK